jgi:thiol-disulfide isomerase/thioredoxin
MKTFATLLLLVGLIIIVPNQVNANSDIVKSPKVIVIKYEAEWCHACRELDKITPAMHKEMEDEPVLFLTLDITDEEAIKQSSLHAAALGIQEDYKKMEGRTGLINVLDAKTKKRLTQLNMTHSAKEMAAMIREQITE